MESLRKPWAVVQDKNGWCLFQVNESGGTVRFSCASEDEARQRYARWEANGRCRECGDVLNDEYIEPVKTQVLARQLCHDCLHWTGYVETRSDPTHLVVNGRHYVISPDTPKGYKGFVGHGGAEFAIRFTDGREVVSHNLWAQGVVPEWFRDRLSDNAQFVKRGHRHIGPYAGYGGAGSADAECPL